MTAHNASEKAIGHIDLVLDAKGLYCPEPVMLLHNRIRELNAGETLQLQATDPSTARDVPKFCLYLGHELLQQTRQGEVYLYHIRKKSG